MNLQITVSKKTGQSIIMTGPMTALNWVERTSSDEGNGSKHVRRSSEE
jgi:hypothetical protein